MLLSLDENYTESALSLLRVPQVLVRQLRVWFPPSPETSAPEPSPTDGRSDTLSNGTHLLCKPSNDGPATTESVCREIYDYVSDYYKTRLAADDIDGSCDKGSVDDGVPGEEVDPEVEQEDSKKELPLFITLTKKVGMPILFTCFVSADFLTDIF